MELKNSYKSCTAEEINSLAERLDTILPESFVQLCLTKNGGELVCPKGEENDLEAARLLPAVHGEKTIESVTEQMEKSGTFPLSAVLFAEDLYGNFFAFSREKESLGRIYLIPGGETVDISECDDFMICDTFDEFLEEIGLK